jgi:hypothetical protein
MNILPKKIVTEYFFLYLTTTKKLEQMKNMYKVTIAFIMLLSMITFNAGAQALSGTVTINSASATAGSNYQSFTAFATMINSVGISGPLVVNVVANSGPYNEQPTFNQISGANASSTITVNGNGNLLTFNATVSTQPWTLNMAGADYFYFNNLNMQGQGATYAIVCAMNGGADNNVFTACTFSAPANGTSSYQVPLCFSPNALSATTGGNSGNNNTFQSCQMYSGYYCIWGGGYTSSPYQSGNKIIGCSIQDFYYYGMYWYYQTYSTIKNNVVERPTRTTLTTTFYGMMIYYNQGSLCEGNIVQKPYDTAPTTAGSVYGYYWYCPLTPQPIPKNTYRNNILMNIKTTGTIYGAYCYYASGDIYHNTFSLDDATSTAGTVYGMYFGGSSTYTDFEIKNNNISITKGGSGTKYGMYAAAMYPGITINGNNIYVNSAGGGNNHGYLSTLGTAATFSAWQGYSVDIVGANVNPTFVNILSDLHPTNNAMDNLGMPLGVVFDQSGAVRNQTTPDFGALEFNTPLCNSTPSANTVVGANYLLCPGQSANLSIGNLNSLSPLGITYQWQYSTVSGVGPWTSIPGANGLTYATPSTYSNTYYSVVISCTNAGGGNTTPVTTVNIATPTQSTVPYFESFEGIGLNNRLPNCSWYSPALGGAAKSNTSASTGNRIARTGSAFGYFDLGAGAGTNYYYTNGITLNAGVTYSVSTWFQTDFTGAVNWTDLSILLGTGQNTTGLVSLASTNGPAVSAIYKSLSGTFSVATTGLYYVAIRGTGSAGTAQYLTWDDLAITIPCVGNNNPNLTVGTNQGTICAGGSAIINATGANSYAWSNGANTSSVSVSPNAQTTYTVVGTSSLSGCTNTVSQVIYVNPAPSIALFANPPVVCSGAPTNLMTSVIGSGVVNFAWSNQMTGANIVVSPTATAAYTVIATGQNGCTSSSAITVSINPLPVLNVAVSNAAICLADNLALTASGASNYQWVSSTSNVVLIGANVNTNINTLGTTVFTVTGTDTKGCQSFTTTNITVNACTGLTELTKTAEVSIYPNPNTGIFTVAFVSAGLHQINVVDVTGRLVNSTSTDAQKADININNMAAGVYYVQVRNGDAISTYKIVKQ